MACQAEAGGIEKGSPPAPEATVGSLRHPTCGWRRLVESAGNAPAWACLQGKCIPCLPRPHWKVASRPGAAPGKL